MAICANIAYLQMVIGLFLQSGKAPPEDHAAVAEPALEPEAEAEPPIPLYGLWQPVKPESAELGSSAL